jgi:hypothetical protein
MARLTKLIQRERVQRVAHLARVTVKCFEHMLRPKSAYRAPVPLRLRADVGEVGHAVTAGAIDIKQACLWPSAAMWASGIRPNPRNSRHFARRAERARSGYWKWNERHQCAKVLWYSRQAILIARSGRIPSGVRPRGLMRMGPQRNFPQEWQCDPDLCPNLAPMLRRCF